MTKYEIAEKIRGLLDYDFDDFIDATLELADEVEAEDEDKRVCPLKFLKKDTLSEKFECVEENCAWWCKWAKCCAMVAIPAKISDRAHDIMQKMEE